MVSEVERVFLLGAKYTYYNRLAVVITEVNTIIGKSF